MAATTCRLRSRTWWRRRTPSARATTTRSWLLALPERARDVRAPLGHIRRVPELPAGERDDAFGERKELRAQRVIDHGREGLQQQRDDPTPTPPRERAPVAGGVRHHD